MSLLPFVYPLALIYPTNNTPPSGSVERPLLYSLNEGVPMYLTKTVESGLDFETESMKISKNPLVKDDDCEYPVMYS